MRLILQVLGRLKYDEVTFTMGEEGKPIKDCFSSRVLAKRLGDSEIIFLVPESLAIELVDNKNDLKELLNNKDKLREEICKRTSINEKCDVIIIQSIGTYKSEGKNFSINFLNTADNISASIIIDLLERIKRYEEIILDVSTGHNIYIASLMDAIRALVVYFKLENIIRGEKIPIFKIAYAPPIMQSKKGEEIKYPIRLYDFDVKAFFDLPLKKNIKIEDLIKKLKNEENIKLRKELDEKFKDKEVHFNELINKTKLAYNAIRYNTPLAYFDDEIISLDIEEEILLSDLKEVLKYIMENKKELENNNEIVIKRPSIERTISINLLLTIAFYEALREFKENLSMPASIDIIEREFKSIYEKVGLGLNSRFLERDLKEIKNLISYLNIEEEVSVKELKQRKLEKLILKFKEHEESDSKTKEGDIKRNFFAHSGFEETVTLIKKIGEKNGGILLRYKPEKKEEIKCWLKNPEK
ncbi:MAG: TM1812 family CRISPR-associated protein [Candidatus Aenigmatarchaeota archaeon]